MTTNRNLKARIRARMQQTGESYAAARAHVVRESELSGNDEATGAERPQLEVTLEDGRIMSGDATAVNAFLDARKRERERRARWPQTPRGEIDTRAAMTALARMFPTLRGADGIDPWNVDRFVRWLCGPVPGGGATCAGRFLLHVWNSDADYPPLGVELGVPRESAEEALRPFNLSEAIGNWDDEHRRALLTWVEAPFWP